jgi:hypothetical protein
MLGQKAKKWTLQCSTHLKPFNPIEWRHDFIGDFGSSSHMFMTVRGVSLHILAPITPFQGQQNMPTSGNVKLGCNISTIGINQPPHHTRKNVLGNTQMMFITLW